VRAALVIHPGALGDVLLAVPALRALRNAGFSITIAAQPRIGALLVTLQVAERAVPFETLGLETLFTDVPVRPDAPLTRHLSEAGRVVCWFGARDAQFARRLGAKAANVVVAPATTTTMPVWEHLLATVGGAADRRPLSVAGELADAGRAALRAAGWDGASRVLLVHPGAGGVSKRWPVEGFVEVLEAVDATLVVHEGPADTEAVRTFLARSRRPVLSLTNPDLPTLSGVLSLCSAYLGNDSGISHLSAAVGTQSVILFTERTLPWLPWSPSVSPVTITTTHLIDEERLSVEHALRKLL
jgi:ADP-heptose:LPS heptosyltransferase